MKKEFLSHLWFTLKDNSVWVYFKKYRDNSIIEVDFEKWEINYLNIECESKTTSNFSQPENFVVLECVNRLLEKWYFAKDIILEKTYKLWHINKWRLDILVKKENKTFLMIECKTWWKEFDKELKNIGKDWWQIFSYFQQDRDAEFIILYSSNEKLEYKNEIIKIEESYRETSNVKDLYDRWNKFTKQNGIFENWVEVYNFESRSLTLKDLKDIEESDASFIFNRFLEILRHNTVSDKWNAFNKIFTLFLCKIHDEWTKMQDEELDFQWKEWIDNHIKFQSRLTDLYKKWMMEFLSKEITDFNNEDFNKEFWYLEETVRSKILEKLTKLRLQKNNEFAIKEVFDDETFEDNATVLKEVVELLQNYRVRYTKKQPFLWDFFELLLTTWLKQEAGQFFTPVPIARFICKSIPIKEVIENKILKWDSSDLLPTTIDYAAWSWHFLTESMEEIQNFVNNIDISKLRPNIKKELEKWKATAFDWAHEYMYGIEKDYRLVKTAKVGCYLHGDWIATVIHWDGLDSFKNSKTYKWKLQKFNPEDKQENAQFDFVLSNPPYSVSAFKWNLKSENASNDFSLFESLTDNSSEIESLFLERTKQLLKEGWIASIILPSSILSNTWIYTKAREIILKNFEIISIVSLGSNTFMATWTNTVVLFMRKRNKFFANNIEKSIKDLYQNLTDVSLNNIESIFSKYVNYVWEWLGFDDYKTIVLKNPNKKVVNHEVFKEYSKKLKLAKNDDLFDEIVKIEKDKMLYFVLSYSQNIVLVKSWEKQVEKEFLGYEFSFRKWSEWIHPIQGWKLIDECTKLFDSEKLDNPLKVSTFIYDWFKGDFTREISPNLQEHIFRTRLVDLLTFDRVDFEKTISTNIRKKISIESKWELVKLSDILETLESWNRPKWWVWEYREWIPSLWWEHIWLNWEVRLENIKYVPGDFFQRSEKWILKNKDILICKDWALTWKVAFFEKEKFWFENLMINEHVFLLRTNEKCNQKYLFDFLFWKKWQYLLKSSITWQAQWWLNRENLLNIKIPLPPKVIQEKIVWEIEVLEKEEQDKKQKVDVLKSEIESIVWWIDWESKKLSDLMNIVRGASPRPIREFQTNDKNWVNWVKIWDVKPESKYITETKEKITLEWAKKSRFVNEWDFILSNSMSFWRPYIMKTSWCIHDGWLLMTDFIEWLDKNYLYSILTSDLVQKQFKLLASWWTSVDNLNIDKVNSVKIPLPSLETQKLIVSQIEKIEKEIEALEIDLKQIPERKKEILKKYL